MGRWPLEYYSTRGYYVKHMTHTRRPFFQSAGDMMDVTPKKAYKCQQVLCQ